MDRNGAADDAARGTRVGVATLAISALSNQLGAASGSLAFPGMGPAGVVAVRQLIAAAVLLPIVRPRFWTLTRRQWLPVILLAVVFGTMNLSLYSSIERIGLGLAVTLEFLGPLAIALLSTRSKASALSGLAAGLGVVAITQPKPSTDYLGIALALVAAASWAAYILLNRSIGRRIPGVTGTATAAGVSALLFLPVALVIFLANPPDPFTALCAVGAGVLASVIPYVADLITLRRITPHVFGILMSINPVFAAIIGTMTLHEVLAMSQWLGIALIVSANVGALWLQSRNPRTEPSSEQ